MLPAVDFCLDAGFILESNNCQFVGWSEWIRVEADTSSHKRENSVII